MKFDLVRRMDWLNEDRVRLYGGLYLGLQALFIIGFMLLRDDVLPAGGGGLGGDFISFFAAGRLALEGQGAGAYSGLILRSMESAVAGHDNQYVVLFFYPPSFLPICAVLAMFPYLPSLFLWSGAGLSGAYLVLRREIGSIHRVWPVFGFGAIGWCLLAGQNGLLMLTLIGGGCLNLTGRRPILAGLCFGLASAKPHLVWLIPIALLAGGQGRAFVAAGVGALILPAIAYCWFGAAPFEGFWGALDLPRTILEDGLVRHSMIHSPFTAVRILGAPVWLAYVVTALAAVYAVSVVGRVWHRQPATPAACAVLMVAACLATPYIFAYDLAILAFPIAWLVQEAARTGFRSWERLMLVVLFIAPWVMGDLARVSVPVGPFIIVAFLQLCLRRAERG